MRSIWFILEKMQGEIAREIRVLLGEESLDQKLFTIVQRERRVDALMKCDADPTNDDESRHLSWMKMHEDLGWVYGEKFDPVAKTHPNMLPWDQLDSTTRSKARIFALVARAGAEIAEFLTVESEDSDGQ